MHYSTDTFRLMSWQGLLAALCLVFLTQFVISLIRAIYNLYFHPLSKVPGPRSWIAIPIIREFAQLRGRHDFEVKALHERYGPIVRIGVDSLSFTSASAWKDIYGHGHAELPKYIPDFYTKLVSTNIINANARDHFRFRRAMLPAFADRALDQQEHIIRAYVDLLVEKLSGQAKVGKPTNMVNWYTYTTFDLIGDLAYGTSFDGLKEGKQNDWIRNIDNMMRMFPILVLATSSPIISKLLMFFASDKIKNSQEEHKRLSTDLTMTRIKNKDMDRRGDFMDLMMRAQGKDHGLTDAELAANSDVLIVAGSETTATLLSGATYYMLKNPACLQKCVEEVRSAFASDADITFKAASAKLPYMLACLDEALRLFPPLPTISLRVTPPGQVSVIDGVEVPGKVSRLNLNTFTTYPY